MKQKLKLKLWRTNSTVHMQILEQEGITKDLSEKIVCNSHICISNDYIYLRGNSEAYDNYIANLIFDTEQEAIDHIAKVVSWLDEVFPAKDKKPLTGETVLVSNNGKNWNERIFISSFRSAYNLGLERFLCVAIGNENLSRKGQFYKTVSWRFMQPISSNWNEDTGIYEAESDS